MPWSIWTYLVVLACVVTTLYVRRLLGHLGSWPQSQAWGVAGAVGAALLLLSMAGAPIAPMVVLPIAAVAIIDRLTGAVSSGETILPTPRPWLAAVGIVLLLLAVATFSDASGPWRSLVQWPALVFVVAFVFGLANVSGQCLACQFLGYRVNLIWLGFVDLVRIGDDYRLAWPRHWRPLLGVVLSSPADGSLDPRRWGRTLAGGALGVLALAPLLLAAGLALPWRSGLRWGTPAPAGDTTVDLEITLLAAGVAAIVAAVTLWRYFAGQVRPLSNDSLARERMLARMMLLAAICDGVRPREWPPAWIAQSLRTGIDSEVDLGGYLLAYAHALDSGQVAVASQHLTRAESATTGDRPIAADLSDEIALEAAYCAARYGADPARARHLLDQTRNSAADPATRRRAEAVVLLAEGRVSEALAVAERGLAILAARPKDGLEIAHADWLREIVTAAEASGTTKVPAAADADAAR